MKTSLCKKHFREVANYFDKETALAYSTDDGHCLICSKVIFVEGARRFVTNGAQLKTGDESLRLSDAAQLGA